MQTDHLLIPILDYNFITDGIYIGTNQCCQTHFDEKLKKGMTVNTAIDFLKSKRPSTHLEKVQQKALVKFLKKLSN